MSDEQQKEVDRVRKAQKENYTPPPNVQGTEGDNANYKPPVTEAPLETAKKTPNKAAVKEPTSSEKAAVKEPTP